MKHNVYMHVYFSMVFSLIKRLHEKSLCIVTQKFKQTKVSQVRRKEMKNVRNGERNDEIAIQF